MILALSYEMEIMLPILQGSTGLKETMYITGVVWSGM